MYMNLHIPGTTRVTSIGLSLFNYQDDARSNKHKPTEVKKGKAVPLQAWSGPGGSRKLRFPDYVTMYL